jgi:hypothetical protein
MATISTTARPAYVYDEAEETWYPVGAQAIAFVKTFEYTATASQTIFTGLDDNGNTLSYTPVAVRVYLNGVLLTPSTDYVATDGEEVVLSVGASVGDILVIVASDTFQVADTYTQEQVNNLLESVGAKGGGTDQVFYENDQTVTTNYTITTNKNAVTAGPVSIDSGIIVTIPDGSVWTVI